MVKIGEKIMRKREAAGISQVTLANMAGISQPYLSDIENGNRAGSEQVLKQITAILGIPLVTEDENDPEDEKGATP